MSVIRRTIQVGFDLRVFFTRGVFAPANPLLRDVMLGDGERTHGVLMVLDESLAQTRPDLLAQIESYFATASERLKLVRGQVECGYERLQCAGLLAEHRRRRAHLGHFCVLTNSRWGFQRNIPVTA